MSDSLPPLPAIECGFYEHYKGGLYKVLGVSRHSETLDALVVYRSEESGEIWVRPAEMWNETVPDPSGSGEMPRFRKVSRPYSARSVAEVNADFAASILRALGRSLDDFEALWPSSKRGTRAQRAWNDIREKQASALKSADDALEALELQSRA